MRGLPAGSGNEDLLTTEPSFGFAAALIRSSSSGLAAYATQKLLGDDEQSQEDARELFGYWQQALQSRLDYLAAALSVGRPELFVDSVQWNRTALQSRDGDVEQMRLSLQALDAVIQEELPPNAAKPSGEYLARALDSLESEAHDVPSALDSEAPHQELASKYLLQLLEGRRKEAIELVLSRVEQGLTVRDAYMHVLVPAQKELGRLWMLNQVSIAEEHYGTATTQAVMSRLQEKFPAASPTGKRVLCATVEDDHHDLGIRIVSDFFEMAGWHPIFLGANLPATEICKGAVDFGVDLIAISVALSPQLASAKELITRVQTHEETEHLPILVGGRVFSSSPDLWKVLGANGCAHTPEEAVEIGTRLVRENSD